jgi:hypothetical protein
MAISIEQAHVIDLIDLIDTSVVAVPGSPWRDHPRMGKDWSAEFVDFRVGDVVRLVGEGWTTSRGMERTVTEITATRVVLDRSYSLPFARMECDGLQIEVIRPAGVPASATAAEDRAAARARYLDRDDEHAKPEPKPPAEPEPKCEGCKEGLSCCTGMYDACYGSGTWNVKSREAAATRNLLREQAGLGRVPWPSDCVEDDWPAALLRGGR